MTTESEKIKRRYDRIAPYFDALEGIMEAMVFKRWRRRLWSKIEGQHLLEAGVGTGKNFPFYPKGCQITAIDFSEKMLEKARQKLVAKNIEAELSLMDVESLCYADNSFDTVVASFVFCSVPHPRKGLKELHRVCRKGGKVILLEHVLSSNCYVASVMDFLNPVFLKLFGANINRQTVKNVQACGFNKVYVEHLGGVVKLIVAIK